MMVCWQERIVRAVRVEHRDGSQRTAGGGDNAQAGLGESNGERNETPSEQPSSLETILDRLESEIGERNEVTLGWVFEVIGTRTFGPLLLMCGLIALSPLSAIPTMPTTIATVVVVVAVQLLLHRKHFWFPEWVLKRTISRRKFDKALRFLRKPARFIDRLLRNRLSALTGSVGQHVIAVLCILIAATMPVLELMPFAASVGGMALSLFGLSLLAKDGLLALVASIGTVLGVGFAAYKFLI